MQIGRGVSPDLELWDARRMDEVTTPVLSRLDAEEREALQRWIDEQRRSGRDIGQGEAMRLLTRDALIGMGLLRVR